VVVRGTCNFSAKAKFCQDAGAIAVLLVNNQLTSPSTFTMTPGLFAEFVTIPVFLIEQTAGQAVRNQLYAGNVVVGLLGNSAGFFSNDVGTTKADVALPPTAARPSLISQSTSDFSPIMGAWVKNFGTTAQSGITLNLKVEQNGNTLYDETSAVIDGLASGDSIFVEMPSLALASYSGVYDVEYLIAVVTGDDFGSNNFYSTTLTVGDVHSHCQINPATNLPTSQAAFKPNPGNGDFFWCTHFRDANASRLAATGIESFVATNATSLTPVLNGEIITITAFEWLDDFTGVSDANFAFDNLNQVGDGEFIIETDTTRWQGFIPFVQPIQLVDDMRYLFCLGTTNTDLFLGGDNALDYDATGTFSDQPVTPILNGTAWNVGFVATQSSNAVRMASTIGIDEQTNTVGQAFPNPAVNELRIPLRSFHGAANLSIVDVAGKVVSSQRVKTVNSQLVVNVEGIAPGSYTLKVTPENGKSSSFKVVISR
jgi:Secretion system C-terminal sorting domain/PA domain